MAKYKYYILLIVLTLLTTCAATAYFTTYINSDYLYGYETAANLMHYGFNGQDFPSAPYYFPDLFIIILLKAFTANITILNFLYSFLFVLTSAYLIFHLIKLSGETSNGALLAACLSLAGFFLILPMGMPLLREWPLSHLSVLLFSLYFLIYYLNQRKKPISSAALILNLTLTYLIFISDNLLLIQFIIPLIIMMAVDYYGHNNSNKLFLQFMVSGLLLITLLGGFTPIWLEKYLGVSFSSNSHLFQIKISQLIYSLQHLGQLLIADIHSNTHFYFLISAYNIIAIAGFFTLRYKSSNFKFIWIFLYLSQVINLTLAVFTGKIVETAHFRYLDALYFYPAIAMSMVLVASQAKHVALLVIIYCCTSFFIINQALLANFSFNPPYNPTVACIDATTQKYALTNGLADYWDVRYVRNLSKNGIMVSQVNKKLELTNFIDNKNLLFADAKNHSPLTYQFILTHNLSTEKIQHTFGKPDKILACPETDVWLYLTRRHQFYLNNVINSSRVKIL